MKRTVVTAAPVGQVLKGILADLEAAQAVSEDRLLELWEAAVGADGFKNSKPYSMNRGVLTVTVKNPSWSQELTLKKRWVLKKLQTTLGKELIHDIRFKTGQL